jgi:hypothetical protein
VAVVAEYLSRGGWKNSARPPVAQQEQLDVLRGGRAAHQQDQPEHVPEDQDSSRSDTSGA